VAYYGITFQSTVPHAAWPRPAACQPLNTNDRSTAVTGTNHYVWCKTVGIPYTVINRGGSSVRDKSDWVRWVGLSVGIGVFAVLAIAMTIPGRLRSSQTNRFVTTTQRSHTVYRASEFTRPNSAMSYPVNGHGQTYGPLPHNNPEVTPPTLIKVQMTSGASGYVYWRQLQTAGQDPTPKTPQQAVALDAQLGKPVSLPVYMENGITVIGRFIIEPPKTEVQP